MTRTFNTPEEAENAFYDAIERGDIKAMDMVWSCDDNIVCIHPGAPRIEGRSDVLDSFQQLFAEAPALSFSIVDTLYTGNEELAIHLVREEVELDGELISVMVSTNIFQFEQGSWRMLLHHASPEPEYVFEDEEGEELLDDGSEPESSRRASPVLH